MDTKQLGTLIGWPFLILQLSMQLNLEKIYERRCMKKGNMPLLTVIIVKSSQT